MNQEPTGKSHVGAGVVRKHIRSKTAIAIMAAGMIFTGCGKDAAGVDAVTADSAKEVTADEPNTSQEKLFEEEESQESESLSDSRRESGDSSAESSEESQTKETVVNTSETETLEEEILGIEKKVEELEALLADDDMQLTITMISEEVYHIWDDELNSLWSRFSNAADAKTKKLVLEEQRTWIQKKEAELNRIAADYEGISAKQLLLNQAAGDYTRNRCYELAKYLAQVTGASFELENPWQRKVEFVDRQGTPDIYSELTIEKVEEGKYTASIGIYRLTTFDGKAVPIAEHIYEFEDETAGVKGLIRITDDGEGATFEVTESTWKYVQEGDVFYFLERL
ncbi:MAG: DUF1311 domain-containing protein [bacterium]|nr:DUF1311 domain-containing protein [bacterium]